MKVKELIKKLADMNMNDNVEVGVLDEEDKTKYYLLSSNPDSGVTKILSLQEEKQK